MPLGDRQFDADLAMPHAAGAFALSLMLLGGGLLWWRFGEAVYVERLFGAIAGCF